MKKVTATIHLNGENKTVTVMLDDKTYVLLKQTGDKALFEHYITEEYEASKIERKETRRHKSLDYLMGKGLEFEDDRQDLFETMAYSEDMAVLKEAMRTLTERQRNIVWRFAVEGQSFRGIFFPFRHTLVKSFVEFVRLAVNLMQITSFGFPIKEH